jgi:hypothetical protein
VPLLTVTGGEDAGGSKKCGDSLELDLILLCFTFPIRIPSPKFPLILIGSIFRLNHLGLALMP